MLEHIWIAGPLEVALGSPHTPTRVGTLGQFSKAIEPWSPGQEGASEVISAIPTLMVLYLYEEPSDRESSVPGTPGGWHLRRPT